MPFYNMYHKYLQLKAFHCKFSEYNITDEYSNMG